MGKTIDKDVSTGDARLDRNDAKLQLSTSRRRFIGHFGGLTAATIAAGSIGLQPLLGSPASEAEAQQGSGESNLNKRRKRSAQIRHDAEIFNKQLGNVEHPNNGDEQRFANRIGNYSKALKHNSIGEVDPAAYAAFLAAISNGEFSQFENLVTNGHFGCADATRRRRLVNPLSGLAFDLQGTDSHQLAMRAAPAFSSAEEAGEMVELYWMALLRDVNFLEFDTNPMAQAAAADLSQLSDFRGPKVGNQVTTGTLFRDTHPGCTTGPYISQFLLKACPFGAQTVDQRMNVSVPNVDYMTNFAEWLDVQNGCIPLQGDQLDSTRRFCRNGRDIGQYVHIDALHQAYFVSCLIMLAEGIKLNPGNPYGQTPDGGAGRPLPPATAGSRSMTPFGTFGGPHILALMPEVSSRALKAVWYQKWWVHRRLRPEEFGGRVEVVRQNLANYPIHSDLFSSNVLDAVEAKTGNHLLPMAFPEGSPDHTAYGSGHATVAGACVTILKAFFDETAVISNPVMPNTDGTGLVPFVGAPLTVGGELNKVCSNISQGRNIAGVHWRTDATESNKLGEAVAISILRDQKATYSEPFAGFTFTKFDGTRITV